MMAFLKKYWPIVILLIITLFLSSANYTPGTFLSGWDTLHPEFNFSLNFQRTFFGVFRLEQGLGTVAGHSHMVELVRLPVLYSINLLTDVSFVRYGYVFLCLILGPLGMYLFLNLITKSKIVRFLGGLFYLLNLSTLQQFVVPFEMFTTQYAALPWLFYLATKYIQEDRGFRSKTLLLFALTTLLASPMAYAATLWYTYFLSLILYMIFLTIRPRRSRAWDLRGVKQIGMLALTSLAVNAFWILPQLYFAINHGVSVSDAVINKLFSPQAFLYNKEFGNIFDIALLKSFLFDWSVYAGRGEFGKLLSVWIDHLNNPFVSTIGFLFAGVALLGGFYAVLKKQRIAIAFLPAIFLSAIFLFNDNFPTSFIYGFLQKFVPLFQEALRFPHSKILGMYTFVFTVFFAYGVLFFMKTFEKTFLLSKIKVLIFLIFSSLLIYFAFPAFKGYLISPYMRVNIPKEYFEMSIWFNNQENEGKIASLPIHSFWGWEYYDWYGSKQPSFQGAGFLWFGIKQPLLNRDFDRWSPQNEQYYREMSYAVYTKNTDLLSQVLKKYGISYIMLDTSIIAPESDSKVLYYEEIKSLLQLLEEQGQLQEKISFGKNLTVYPVSETLHQEPVLTLKDVIQTSSNPNIFYEDFLYREKGDYTVVNDRRDDRGIYYPFLSLSDNLGKTSQDIVTLRESGLSISPGKREETLTLPSYLDYEESIPAQVLAEYKDGALKLSFYPLSYIEGLFHSPLTATLSVQQVLQPPIILSVNQKNTFSVDLKESQQLGIVYLNTKSPNTVAIYEGVALGITVPDFSRIDYDLNTCAQSKGHNFFGIDIDEKNRGFSLFGKDTEVCLFLPLANLPGIQSVFSAANDEEILLQPDFSSEDSAKQNVCIARLETGACIANFQSPTDYFGVKRNELSTLGVRFYLDASGPIQNITSPFGQLIVNEKKEQRALYVNVSFIVRKPFAKTSFAETTLKSVVSPVLFINPSKDTILIPFDNKMDKKNVVSFKQLENTCGGGLTEHVRQNKKNLKEKDGVLYIEFQSLEGPLCSSRSFFNLSKSSAYLIAVTSRHQEGLPLTICISNPDTKRCGLYTSLSKSQDKTTNFFLLPEGFTGKNGIDININNFAIRKTPSVNELYDIRVVPFPYEWLRRIHGNDSQSGVTLSVITNPYAYDEGWKAYQVKSDPFDKTQGHPERSRADEKLKVKSYLQMIFPFFFGEELKNHALVNNWANGWVLNKCQMSNVKCQIVIIYLPQYLQYFGFVLLAVFPVGLLFVHLRSVLGRTRR